MYERLGIAWASSLLGFLSLLMCVIPFVFVKYGEVIRGRSRFCIYLKEKKEAEMAKQQAEVEAAAAARMTEGIEKQGVDEKV
jgi:hypothetical protein